MRTELWGIQQTLNLELKLILGTATCCLWIDLYSNTNGDNDDMFLTVMGLVAWVRNSIQDNKFCMGAQFQFLLSSFNCILLWYVDIFSRIYSEIGHRMNGRFSFSSSGRKMWDRIYYFFFLPFLAWFQIKIFNLHFDSINYKHCSRNQVCPSCHRHAFNGRYLPPHLLQQIPSAARPLVCSRGSEWL